MRTTPARLFLAHGGSIGERSRAKSRIQIPAQVIGTEGFAPFCYVKAAANLLTNPALDPYGKVPEVKYAACRLAPG